jgi:NADH dehydrogenase FAD-containing subunit
MSTVVVLGGGFSGVVAAQALAKRLGREHKITLVSRSHRFLFFPSLVRLAFGKCEPDDIASDLREIMIERRVQFIEAEVARIDPQTRRVIIAHGEVEGNIPYDYLLFALGRRLATERITGFFEYAHHLLSLDAAMKFGSALGEFHSGRAVIGQCAGARLPVPVYETAFALSRLLEQRGEREQTRITIVSPDAPGLQFGDGNIARALRGAMDAHNVEYLPDYRIQTVSPGMVMSDDGQGIKYNLLMLLPPFRGSSAAKGAGITDDEDYIKVDRGLKVSAVDRMYAAGDCVSFPGPKLGHMAVHQAEVAAENIAAEIQGLEPKATYDHEIMLVIDEGGSETIFLHKGLWDDSPANVKQSRFWSWAKRIHEKYWQYQHSLWLLGFGLWPLVPE